MAVRSHVPLRPKFFHKVSHLSEERESSPPSEVSSTIAQEHVKSDLQPVHGHVCEYLVSGFALTVNIMFVVGSICFFEGWPTWVSLAGVLIFIVGSFIGVLLAAWGLQEAWMSHKWKERNEEDKKEKLRSEIMENVNYVVASAIFCVGSFFFWPGIYKTKLNEEWGNEIGAWFFIAGSFGFVLASYWNALGIASEFGGREEKSTRDARAYRLSTIALCFTMIGGVCFVTGSFLYRPGYSNTIGCKSSESLLAIDSTEKPFPSIVAPYKYDKSVRPSTSIGAAAGTMMLQIASASAAVRRPALARPNQTIEDDPFNCVNAVQHGTWLYLIGSFCFVAQSSLSIRTTFFLHKGE